MRATVKAFLLEVGIPLVFVAAVLFGFSFSPGVDLLSLVVGWVGACVGCTAVFLFSRYGWTDGDRR